MLHRFSNLVCEIYKVAEAASPDEFAPELVRLIRGLIVFDGALLCTGRCPNGPAGPLEIDSAYVFNRAPGLAEDYAASAGADTSLMRLCEGLDYPVWSSCREGYAGPCLHPMQELNRKYDIVQRLAFGSPSSATALARWIALYRRTDIPFDQTDATILAELWPHIVHSTSINQRAFLKLQSQDSRSGFALLSSNHVLEAADATFTRLMQLEWPCRKELPESIWSAMQCAGAYMGRKIEMTAHACASHILCQLAERTTVDADILTPAERVVAARYALGLSHKQIASDLLVSANTIRTHLAHVYGKMGIHSKAELIHKLGGGGP